MTEHYISTVLAFLVSVKQQRGSENASPPQPGREFLSDAPFFGLSLWTQFKLALCACASGWSSTLEPRTKLGDGSIWSIQL